MDQEEQLDALSGTIIELSEEFGKFKDTTEKDLSSLKLKLKAFSMAVLKNTEKEQADKIFKEYQRLSFTKES